MDRSAWPWGPWSTEPDRVMWFSGVGLPCEMLRNDAGAWCGYVAVSRSHPFNGMVLSGNDRGLWSLVDSQVCFFNGLAEMYPGEDLAVRGGADVWYGFSCSHCRLRGWPPSRLGSMGRADEYCDAVSVQGACEHLASQLDAASLLVEAGVGGPVHARGETWSAPAWATAIARRFDVPRDARVALVRRLVDDPVAARLASVHGVANLVP